MLKDLHLLRTHWYRHGFHRMTCWDIPRPVFSSHIADTVLPWRAIYHGIPVVGIPFLYDQHHNAEKLSQRNGMGITLDFDSLTERDLHSGHIVYFVLNSKFSRNAQLASKLFRDPRTSPQETMLYWFDYVIRYQGAKHLTQQYQPVNTMPLYQYFFLDVIAIAVTIIFATLFAVYILSSCMVQIRKSIMKTHSKRKQE